jgi:hypothetical protein
VRPPPPPPLTAEKRRFQLFAAPDDVDPDLNIVNQGRGTKLQGVKLEQQQQQQQRQQDSVPSLHQAAPSSNTFPGNRLMGCNCISQMLKLSAFHSFESSLSY